MWANLEGVPGTAYPHASWRPLHEEIHPFVRNRGKAQPFVEPQGRVELLHMDTHGLPSCGGFGQEVAQDGGADASVIERETDDENRVYLSHVRALSIDKQFSIRSAYNRSRPR